MTANLYDLLASRFPADRSKPCFILSDGIEISYGALESAASRVASRLIAEGVKPGDRVVLQAEKSAESIMIYLGVLKAGAVFVPAVVPICFGTVRPVQLMTPAVNVPPSVADTKVVFAGSASLSA